MPRFVCVGLILSGSLLAGCGSGTEALPPEDAAKERRSMVLGEVGEMLNLFQADSKGKGPAKVADLARYEVGFPSGFGSVKDGSVVVVWGVATQTGVTDKIIAYEKEAADSGGSVLMQDGVTMKNMTADEFKAAPKAGGAK